MGWRAYFQLLWWPCVATCMTVSACNSLPEIVYRRASDTAAANRVEPCSFGQPMLHHPDTLHCLSWCGDNDRSTVSMSMVPSPHSECGVCNEDDELGSCCSAGSAAVLDDVGLLQTQPTYSRAVLIPDWHVPGICDGGASSSTYQTPRLKGYKIGGGATFWQSDGPRSKPCWNNEPRSARLLLEAQWFVRHRLHERPRNSEDHCFIDLVFASDSHILQHHHCCLVHAGSDGCG